MPDLVVLEALGPKCFHYTFTGFGPSGVEPRTRQYFPGNRVTVTAAYAATINTNTPGLFRNVVDYNVAPYPPAAWPASGSIPAMVLAEAEAPPPPPKRAKREANHG
jgi:hypothetical protein